MRFPAALSVAFIVLGTVAAHADFDLKLACRVSKVPSGYHLVPKDVEIEFDLNYQRARVRDEVISEVNDGWQIVDGVNLRKGGLVFSYTIFPSMARIRRSDFRYQQKFKYSYRIDRSANTFRLTVINGYGAIRPQHVKGKCVANR